MYRPHTPHYLLAIRRASPDAEIVVKLMKAWWLGPGQGTRNATLRELSFLPDEPGEKRAVIAALRAMADELETPDEELGG